MKKVSCALVLSFLLIIFSIFGCKKSNPSAPETSPYNNPVIADSANSFAFTVDAQLFSYTVSLPLQFKNVTTLNSGFVIKDFQNGSGRVIIYDSTNAILLDQKISGPLVYGNQSELFTEPKKISISFTNFTGNVTMGFTGK